MTGLSPGGGLSNSGGLNGQGGSTFSPSGMSSGSGLSPSHGHARLFGVNVGGPEWAPWFGQAFPTAADWSYLGGFGIKTVRLAVAWESLQPTLSAALDPTYLAAIKTAIASAAANGIGVIVSLQNFGAYVAQAQWTTTIQYAGNSGHTGTGVNFLGDATLTTAAFADLWTRLSTALAGTTGLAGYGLMNEPSVNIPHVNLVEAPNYFGPAYFTQSYWFNFAGAVATQQAAGSNPLGAGYSPAWQFTNGNTTGFAGFGQNIAVTAVPYTLSLYMRTLSGTQAVSLNIDATSASQTVTTAWTRYSLTATPGAGSKFMGFFYNSATPALNNVQVANMMLNPGSSALAYAPNPYQIHAQAGISAIRAVDTTTPIYVGAYNTFTGPAVPIFSYEYALLTGGGLIFDCHQYFDGPQGQGDGGVYSGSYASYSIDTQSGVQALTPFQQWLSDIGGKGYVGEFNIPNNATPGGNANWLILQQNFLNYLRVQNIPASAWQYSSATPNSADQLNILPVGGVEDPRFAQVVQS